MVRIQISNIFHEAKDEEIVAFISSAGELKHWKIERTGHKVKGTFDFVDVE